MDGSVPWTARSWCRCRVCVWMVGWGMGRPEFPPIKRREKIILICPDFGGKLHMDSFVDCRSVLRLDSTPMLDTWILSCIYDGHTKYMCAMCDETLCFSFCLPRHHCFRSDTGFHLPSPSILFFVARRCRRYQIL